MARKYPRCPREGTEVVFEPNPVSLALYSAKFKLPKKGETGHVTTIPGMGGRSTCIGGPGGGLVFVDWEHAGTMGISIYDLKFKVKSVHASAFRPVKK